MSAPMKEEFRITDTYHACSIVEGFDGEEHTQEEELAAWQYLYDAKAYKWLQGWYGRSMRDLIQAGLITPYNG